MDKPYYGVLEAKYRRVRLRGSVDEGMTAIVGGKEGAVKVVLRENDFGVEWARVTLLVWDDNLGDYRERTLYWGAVEGGMA